MLLLFQVGEDQPLPVAGQHLFAAVGIVLEAAAGGQGLQFQVHLGVVAERFVVAHPFHRLSDGLLIEDAALAEGYLQPEPAGQQALQHLQLDLAHQADVDLAQLLVPDDVQLGHLLLDAAEAGQGGVDVRPLGQQDLIGQHRFEQRIAGVPLGPEALARLCAGKAGHGADLAGVHLVCQGVFGPRVEPQLVGLAGPALPFRAAGEGVLDFQDSAGHPQPGQAGPLLVLRDLKDPRAEVLPGGGGPGPAGEAGQQGVHPFQLEGRAEPAGENVPPGNGGDDIPVGQRFAREVGVHQPLVAEGQRLVPGGGVRPEIHKTVAEAAAQLFQDGLPPRPGQVHLVDKEKGGHPAAAQQGPQGLGVALHPVGPADDQHRIVQHLDRPLGLGRKVDMAGGVQPGDLRAVQAEQRLFGKNGDAPRPLQAVGIEKGVPVVHPAQFADGPGAVEHRLREGGLARVDVGQHPHHQAFCLVCHGRPLTGYWPRCRWPSWAIPRSGWTAYCTGPFPRR